jgi:hypothetical protein
MRWQIKRNEPSDKVLGCLESPGSIPLMGAIRNEAIAKAYGMPLHVAA